MRKPITLLAVLLLSLPVVMNGQQTRQKDFYEDIRKYDLSILWTPGTSMYFRGEAGEEFEPDQTNEVYERPEPVGYIGDNYQRFRIHFISVIQNKDNLHEYMVYGKTKVRNNICSFQGVIKVEKASIVITSEETSYKEGQVSGSYLFYEDSKQSGTGILKGTFTSDFVIDEKDSLHYNALSLVSDSYCNNQFKGNWQSYKNSISKKCNWGDFRVPERGDLDVGAGEFSVNPIYYKNGWETYTTELTQSTPQGEEMRRKESIQWWKD